MQEKINISELEKSLNNIKTQTETIKNSLLCIDNIIIENINTGVGILDGNSGEVFKKKWEILREEIPTTFDVLNSQENNLETFINTMKEEEQ